MREQDYDAFTSMLDAVAEYYGRPLSTAMVAIYWQGLKDLELSTVRQALTQHVQNPDTGQYMPKIADIRKMIGGTTHDAALVAWTKVDQAVRSVGTYRDVVFDDPIIHRVIYDMGGWISLGSKKEEEWPFVEREFVARYRGYASKRERPVYLPVLTGISNSHNVRHGYPTEPPHLVGDPEQCRAVLSSGTNQPLIQTMQLDVAKVA